MPLQRLRGRKICDFVLRKGKVWKGKTLSVRFVLGAPRHPAVDPEAQALYVGCFASSKLDKSAVRRNRMRRRCREALRISLNKHGDLPAAQLLLCPKTASLDAPFEDILGDVSTFLSTLAQCPKPPKNHVS